MFKEYTYIYIMFSGHLPTFQKDSSSNQENYHLHRKDSSQQY